MRGRGTMHYIIVLSSGWGYSFGGINVFNKLMCEGLARQADVVNTRIVCVAPKISSLEIAEAKQINLELISLESDSIDNVYEILFWLKRIFCFCDGDVIDWIGHDTYSDGIVFKCHDYFEEYVGVNVKSNRRIVINHMAYGLYYPLLNLDADTAQEKENKQKNVMEQCDIVLANGPLLTEYSEDILGDANGKVRSIYPGICNVSGIRSSRNHNFSVVTFGRIEPAIGSKRNNTIIKQIYLAAASWAQFTREKPEARNSILKVYGKANDIGVDNELKEIIAKYSEMAHAYSIVQYNNDRERLLNDLAAFSVCLILSIHEGFGLTSLEAVSAGVPLVVSKNSGFYKMLNEKKLTSYVHVVDIKGSYDEPYFVDDDVEEVVKALCDIYEHQQEAKDNAIYLRNLLLKMDLTWDKSARDILDILDEQKIESCNNVVQKANDESVQKTISDLSRLFWERYEIITIDKDIDNKSSGLSYKIGNVFNAPEVQLNGQSYDWGVLSLKHNVVIEAPNGHGKTTFLRSILLSSLFGYIDTLSGSEKKKYEEMCKYHKLDNSFFCIYLECKDMDIESLGCEGDELEWIYKTLSNVESINIDKYIDRDAFRAIISKYNELHKLIILVDGFDEVEAEHRKKIIGMLKGIQQRNTIGEHALIIMASRPFFWKENFNGYKRLSISSNNMQENQKAFLQYITNYSFNGKYFKPKEFYSYIVENPYLRMIACIPAIIIWIVRGYQAKSDIFETVDRVIAQMMLRYKTIDSTVHLQQYKRVYEVLAFRYLCLIHDQDGIADTRAELHALIKGCVDGIKQEGDKNFITLFSDENIPDKELGERFFTNVALMECHDRKIKFTTIVFAYHLCACYLLREIAFYECVKDVIGDFECISAEHRYYVLVIMASIAPHLSDIRFFAGFGDNAKEIQFDVAELIAEYMGNRWEDTSCTMREKEFIQKAAYQITNEQYGQNVFSNKRKGNEEYSSWLDNILKPCCKVV